MFKLNVGIICAAGLGTRVSGILGRKSKEMVSVLGKPALQHHIDLMLRLNSFNDIVVITNSKKSDIIDYMFENFKDPYQKNLLKNPKVVGHTIFNRELDVDEAQERRSRRVRIHLVVLDNSKIGTNPLDSIETAYDALDFNLMHHKVFVTFADIVVENMADEIAKQINSLNRDCNYISALNLKDCHPTLRIENCGRFSLCSFKDELGRTVPSVKNLTSALSGTDNASQCTHLDIGMYYGDSLTILNTAGTWIYDRMLTSLKPILPLMINNERLCVDLGDPRTYTQDLVYRPEHPVQQVSINVEIER